MRSRRTRGTLLGIAVAAVLASAAFVAIGVSHQPGASASRAAAPVSYTTRAPAAHAAVAKVAPENSIVFYAASQAGDPYCYGGGGINGPGPETNNSSEPGCAPPAVGYDCMSLAQFAVYQGTGHAVALPSNGTQLKGVGTFIPPQSTEAADVSELKPGDVVFFGGSIDNYHHSGIFAGNGELWDALDDNIPVGAAEFSAVYSDYGDIFDGAYRYSSDPLLSVTTASLPAGTVFSSSGKAYSATLHAASGYPPYTWSLVKGSKALPGGLALSSKGVISGHAKAAGTFSFEVRVGDAGKGPAQQVARRTLSITIRS